jgi:hypothetical protein
MIPKSGNRFSDKIMHKLKNAQAAVYSRRVSIQRLR